MMKKRMVSAAIAAVIVSLSVLATPSANADPGPLDIPKATIPDAKFAPPDRPGPALIPSPAKLRQSLHCNQAVDQLRRSGAAGEAILFVHGTLAKPADYASTWIKQLQDSGRAFCYVTIPGNAAGDTQINGQYVVNAIRETYRRSGKKIDIIGHSQGGLLPRYALRFWPDTRAMVDDLVSLAATNHGSVAVSATVCAVPCAPAAKQQALNAAFVQATNSYQETFRGISYTQIYTKTDQFVQPNLNNSGTSSLHTGDGKIVNVAVQDICPGWVADHLMLGLTDPVAYALAMDAIDHPGPANLRRINRSVCGKKVMPAVPDPAAGLSDVAKMTLSVLQGLTGPGQRVTVEPRLFKYTFAS